MAMVAGLFDSEKAVGIDAKVQLHITGEQAGDWIVSISDQKLSIAPGVASDPTLTFSAESKDIIDVYNGKISPMQAYVQGKVIFLGDISTAVRLARLFSRPQ